MPVAGILGASAALAAGLFGAVVTAVARRVVIPVPTRPLDARVLSAAPRQRTITLAATPDTLLPGRYGLWVPGSERYHRLGPVLERTTQTVTRELIEDDEVSRIVPGPASFSGWYFRHPAELGLEFADVMIETELGDAPAWRFPAPEPSADAPWAILVHGRGVQRPEVLRAVPVLHAAGYECLVVSYRNDGEAPASADGRYGLGATEWRDVDAALAYAAEHGAPRVVLMGWSMGGAIVLQTAQRSIHDSIVDGVILDSPVVDWRSVLRFQAKASRIPPLVRDTAMWLIGSRAGRLLTGLRHPIDLDRLDRVAHAGELHHPVLILHSDDDGFVPSDASHALAEARPDLVTLVTFSVARHTKLWNFAPERWSDAISEWLARLNETARSAT
ncbi:alpha/beta hydrolase family protein [Paramicrobacterium humi]|uniref:alpha/beta hydrolase family protein n=1 Tax=Paramicrobacterium humi TaxID=640635 RepID=UPI001FDEB6BF|nr:alpha/beta fold hydrolase [Microbacterium humi]